MAYLRRLISELKATNEALTSENEKLKSGGGLQVHPVNMVMPAIEYAQLHQTAFCWRWYRRDDTDYRLLTIEGENLGKAKFAGLKIFPNGL